MFVYIASSKKYSGIIKEDIYIKDKYIERGFSCEILPLEDIVKRAKSGDIVMLKSIWGYHTDINFFSKQINILERKNINLINNFKYVYWNLNKEFYLNEIKELGYTPTIFLNTKKYRNKNEIDDFIYNSLANLGYSKFVIKPTISASGYLTFLSDFNNFKKTDISKILYKNNSFNFMLQPFRETIKYGEISVIMIAGEILYSIRRYPGVVIDKKK